MTLRRSLQVSRVQTDIVSLTPLQSCNTKICTPIAWRPLILVPPLQVSRQYDLNIVELPSCDQATTPIYTYAISLMIQNQPRDLIRSFYSPRDFEPAVREPLIFDYYMVH
jgi:hypothetical protein